MMRGMTTQPLHKICLGLCSNLGDRLANLRTAFAELRKVMTISASSLVYENPAAFVTDQPDFLNAAVSGETVMDPEELLRIVKNIEHALGRKPTFRNGPRVIDIDILFYDDLKLSAPGLTIPHPGVPDRMFVLRPLDDIVPDWPHPVTGLTVRAMLKDLPDTHDMHPSSEAL